MTIAPDSPARTTPARADGSTLLIGDTWSAAADGGTFSTLDPATGRPIAVVAAATATDVDAAVAAAQQAGTSAAWAGLSVSTRGRLLWALADAVDAHAEELSVLETTDQGQPLWAARIGIAEAADHLRYFAGWTTKLGGASTPLSTPGLLHRSRRLPLGVCALITPWNFPLQIAIWKIAPALATGNTVVVKPAEQTPLSTVRFGELAQSVGVPPGVLNILTGGPEVGRALVAHPGVAKVSFTGSTEVGREIAAVAGRRFARVSLELGGKTPSIITPTADLARAVAGNAGGGLFNAGQTCAAFSRLYVHRSRAEEFTDRLQAAVGALRVGPGMAAGTELGPLVTAEHRIRVAGFVEDALAAGATVRTGGCPVHVEGADGGFYYAPTVLSDVTDDMAVARQEVFGPVLSVLTYDDEDEVVARANDSDYGLAGVVWSQDIGEANRIAEQLRSGTVWINSAPALDVGSAWGGFRSSGVGREMGWEAVLAYTELSSVLTAVT